MSCSFRFGLFAANGDFFEDYGSPPFPFGGISVTYLLVLDALYLTVPE